MTATYRYSFHTTQLGLLNLEDMSREEALAIRRRYLGAGPLIMRWVVPTQEVLQ